MPILISLIYLKQIKKKIHLFLNNIFIRYLNTGIKIIYFINKIINKNLNNMLKVKTVKYQYK